MNIKTLTLALALTAFTLAPALQAGDGQCPANKPACCPTVKACDAPKPCCPAVGQKQAACRGAKKTVKVQSPKGAELAKK